MTEPNGREPERSMLRRAFDKTVNGRLDELWAAYQRFLLIGKACRWLVAALTALLVLASTLWFLASSVWDRFFVKPP